MKLHTIILDSPEAIKKAIDILKGMTLTSRWVMEIRQFKDKRTLKQNNTMHEYFGWVADELNNAGWDMRRTLREDIEIPWTQKTVKEYLWRDLQIAMTGKKSTTQLTTKEVGQVYEVLSRHLSQKLGVYVPFPKRKENEGEKE